MAVHEVTLGADTWVLLARAAQAVPLPEPFRGVDGPELTDEQASAAEAALRSSELVPGGSSALTNDLHPSLQASLLLHLRPDVVVDAWVGLGPDFTATRAALAGELASSFARPRQALPEGVELGPVTWRTMLVDDLAGSIADGLGIDGDAPDAPALVVDPATALAIVRAVESGNSALASAVLGEDAGPRGGVPEPLASGALGLDAIARVDVSGTNGRTVLMALEADGGWWTATSGDGELELTPVGRREFVADLASLLTASLFAKASQ